MKLVVVPHDLQWRDDLKKESTCIAATVGGNRFAIHHIASTAIRDI